MPRTFQAELTRALEDAHELDRWIENDIEAGDEALTVWRDPIRHILSALELALLLTEKPERSCLTL